MKKKLITVLLASIVVVTLFGCSSSSKQTSSTNAKETTNQEKAKIEEPKKEEKKQPPVTIEQLPINITIRQPDSIGNVYMDATFSNNSDKNIVGYNVTMLLKDSNKTTYLSDYDTILPGETSPKFNSFGPKSMKMDDIQILKYEITIAKEDGSKTHLEYDNKLKQYKWN